MICVITAHNPGGQTVSEEENAKEQERLERELKRRRWTWWRATAGDSSGEHLEASAAAVGVEESKVVMLGAEFGQDAIFVLTPVSRRVVGCLSTRDLSTGWSVSAEPPPGLTKTVAPERPSASVTSAVAVETEDKDEDIDEDEGTGEDDEGIFQCWCAWAADDDQYTHDEYRKGVELQFGERGLPPHEPSLSWNLPEPEDDTPPE